MTRKSAASEGYCDNAHCRNTGEVELFPVQMGGVFAKGAVYNWCRECIDRDEDIAGGEER